jgi:hypothetical protein
VSGTDLTIKNGNEKLVDNKAKERCVIGRPSFGLEPCHSKTLTALPQRRMSRDDEGDEPLHWFASEMPGGLQLSSDDRFEF